jgi:hypothetical protein
LGWLRESNGKSNVDEILETIKRLEAINKIVINLSSTKIFLIKL